MRTTILGFIIGASTIGCFATVAISGPLTPPGAPAPSMKTLEEVEPRIPVQSLAGNAGYMHIIDQPGSYYFTGDIQGDPGKSGILINAGQVTLDLNGFSLRGEAGTIDGIAMSTYHVEIVIRNGSVVDWEQDGIDARIDYGLIERIVASRNGGWGIKNGGAGTYTTRIKNCQINNSGSGALVISGGIYGGIRSIVENNELFGCRGFGIVVENNSVVRGNVIQDTSPSIPAGMEGRCIYTDDDDSVIDSNILISTDIGIYLDAGAQDNVVMRNTIKQAGTSNILTFGGNSVAPSASATTATNPVSNIIY